MDIKNIKWGIWGYGVVGKSVAAFLHAQGAHIAIFDHTISHDKQCPEYHFYKQDELLLFLDEQRFIVPSPGIDISLHYATYKYKIIPELDLFYTFFKKPIIAITGSVGKTTITTIMSLMLNALGLNVFTGGNIGIGMCTALTSLKEYDVALLEVSSFQLEYIRLFAPHIAIITPFYANHLDRHTTLEEYRRIKLSLLSFQTPDDHALIPETLQEHLFEVQSRVHIYQKDKPHMLTSYLPPFTFEENMHIIAHVIDILGINHLHAIALLESVSLVQNHRLEQVKTAHTITFINDSKSTTSHSTLAAVTYFKNHSLLLVCGGLSKGVNRKEFVASLHGLVKKVYCFGKEAEQLFTWCKEFGIPSESHKQLYECILSAYNEAHAHDTLLFSPGGASFDLFKNYEERGNYFKKIIQELTSNVY